MGNTCAARPAPTAVLPPRASPRALSAADGQRPARAAFVSDAVETVLLESGLAEEERAADVAPEGALAQRRCRGRKPTGFAFPRPGEPAQAEDEDEGAERDAADGGRRGVPFSDEGAEVVQPEGDRGDEEAEGAPSPDTASPSPVLLASPTPRRMGRKPTGRPTREQICQAWQQEGTAAAAGGGAPERRQRVRKDTGHPRTDGRRTKAKRALAKLLGA